MSGSRIKLCFDIFTPNEVMVLKTLSSSYKKATAEVLFTQNEIKVLKILMKSKSKQTTSGIADAAKISFVTAKNELDALKEKGLVETEPSGKKILWWHKPQN
jgi:DNA-binding MarR family transcriptional regulator